MPINGKITKNILFDISFVAGTGCTCLYYFENENDDERFDAGTVINKYLVRTTDINYDETFIESVYNPNPSKELRQYLRTKKLERIEKMYLYKIRF